MEYQCLKLRSLNHTSNIDGFISRCYRSLISISSLHGNCSTEIPKHGICGTIRIALLSRVVVLTFMAISCLFFLDFTPGNDVLIYNMRLNLYTNEDPYENKCFCLAGHSCDKTLPLATRLGLSFLFPWSDINYINMYNHHTDNYNCADLHYSLRDTIKKKNTTSSWWYLSDIWYHVMLTPLTRWDAARFLTLAVNPFWRYTLINPSCHRKKYKTVPFEDNGSREESCFKLSSNNMRSSEEAHAFLPLFPLVLRYTAIFLTFMVPSMLLPSSFEAVIVLSALVINVLFFVGAAISLYFLTYFLLYNHYFNKCSDQLMLGIITNRDVTVENNSTVEKEALVTAIIFCFNSASIFFTSSYSESMFSFLIFASLNMIARQKFVIATTLLSLSTCTRSNGVFFSIYFIIGMIAIFVRYTSQFMVLYLQRKDKTKMANISKSEYTKIQNTYLMLIIKHFVSFMYLLLRHMAISMLIVLPLIIHDENASFIFCSMRKEFPQFYQLPKWCRIYHNQNRQRLLWRSSLYTYVQQKYWDIGFLQYYKWKQVPNFLLAFPIIFFGVSAVINWVYCSWFLYTEWRFRHGSKLHLSIKSLFYWMWFSINEFDIDMQNSSNIHYKMKKLEKKSTRSFLFYLSLNRLDITTSTYFPLLGPKTLPHYVLMAFFCFIGALVTHVQISTRFIGSSCPAIYWYITFLFLQRKRFRTYYFLYIFMFNTVGIFMHVNWFPWT